MEEIKKTVTNAILQAEKYDSELNKANDDLFEYIQAQQYLGTNGLDLIPDIDNILDQNPDPNPNFHIGQPVSATWNMNGHSLNILSSLSNGIDVDAGSIIEDNEHLRQR